MTMFDWLYDWLFGRDVTLRCPECSIYLSYDPSGMWCSKCGWMDVES